MAEHKTLVLPAKQASFVLKSVPLYTPGPGEVLIKTEAAALAPIDWAISALGVLVENYPVIIGEDVAGTVEDIGDGVTRFKKGDRVMYECTLEGDAYSGFQQYTLAKEDITAKIPDNLSFDQAATIPLALSTAVIGLYDDGSGTVRQSCGLTPPWLDDGRGKYKGQPALVFSGTSTVGQMAIQLLKLSGFGPIITTASLRHTEFLKTRGATHVIDRNLPAEALKAEIFEITQKPLKIIYDAVASDETQNVAYDILAPGGALAHVKRDAIKAEKKVPQKKAFFVYGDVNISLHRKLGASLYSKLTALLEEGALKPVPVEVAPGGLGGIPAALEKVKDGLSGGKLVVHPQDTE